MIFFPLRLTINFNDNGFDAKFSYIQLLFRIKLLHDVGITVWHHVSLLCTCDVIYERP